MATFYPARAPAHPPPRWPLVVAAFVLVVAAARTSRAQASRPIGDVLTVEPGATCLDAATLADHIRAWLGSNALAADVAVKVQGSSDQPRTVRFEAFRGGQIIATRQFDPGPASCEHLHAAVALAIAMAVNPALLGELAAPIRPVTAGASPGEPAPRPWALGVSALGTTNVLAGVALGLDARVQRSLTSSLAVRAGLFALASLPGRFEGLGGHYNLELLAAQLDLCTGVGPWGWLRLQGCTGFAGGPIVARGYSFTVSQIAVKPWMAVVNGIALIAALGPRWSLDLSLGLLLPLERMSLLVSNPTGGVVRTRDLDLVGDFAGLGVTYRL